MHSWSNTSEGTDQVATPIRVLWIRTQGVVFRLYLDEVIWQERDVCQDRSTCFLWIPCLETSSWRLWKMTIQCYHRSRRHYAVNYSTYSNTSFTRLPSRCLHFTSQYMIGVRPPDCYFWSLSFMLSIRWVAFASPWNCRNIPVSFPYISAVRRHCTLWNLDAKLKLSLTLSRWSSCAGNSLLVLSPLWNIHRREWAPESRRWRKGCGWKSAALDGSMVPSPM